MSYHNGPRIVTDGLVLLLDAGNSKSYPGSGTLWTDLSGNSNNGTLTNGPTYSSANKGGIVFDGTNDYINCGPILNFGGPSSVATIIIVAKGTGKLISNQRTNSNHGWIDTNISNNELSLYIDAYTGPPYGELFYAYSSGTPYSLLTNNWNFYSIVINRPIHSYTMGINDYFFDYTRNFTVVGYQNFNTIELGRTNNFIFFTNYLTGQIATAHVYNRALSKSEILQNYNALKGRFNL